MPRTKPASQHTAPATGIATPGDPSRQWVSTSMSGLMPGTNLVPFTGDSVFLTSSPELAEDFWPHPNRFVGYYRVLPEGEPVAVDAVRGIYRCDRAMITHELDNGTAAAALELVRSSSHHAA